MKLCTDRLKDLVETYSLLTEENQENLNVYAYAMFLRQQSDKQIADPLFHKLGDCKSKKEMSNEQLTKNINRMMPLKDILDHGTDTQKAICYCIADIVDGGHFFQKSELHIEIIETPLTTAEALAEYCPEADMEEVKRVTKLFKQEWKNRGKSDEK